MPALVHMLLVSMCDGDFTERAECVCVGTCRVAIVTTRTPTVALNKEDSTADKTLGKLGLPAVDLHKHRESGVRPPPPPPLATSNRLPSPPPRCAPSGV